MKKIAKPILQLTIVAVSSRTHCYWCGQSLRKCGMCYGSGRFRNDKCKACKGHGCMCPTHEGDWDD